MNKTVNTFAEALEFINSRKISGMRFQMDRIKHILELLDNPQKKCKFIHVTGTNGKGSTIAFLTNLFQANNKSVGTFTSPFMGTFLNHYHYNNMEMKETDFIRIINRLIPLIEEMDKVEGYAGITEFEVATAIMFLYFSELNPDVVIVEVGMGGLTDSTNVLIPEISVITTIGLDHTGILGTTLEEIAVQKAGIIKPNKVVVTGDIPSSPLAIIEKEAEEKNNTLIKLNSEYNYFDVDNNSFNYKFSYNNFDIEIPNIKLEMFGLHQVKNSSLALSTFLIYCLKNDIKFDISKIKESLNKTSWNGRFEIISKSPMIILDGAHNVDGMKCLLDTINSDFKDYKIKYLYASLANKDTNTMIPMIDKVSNISLTFTEFDYFGVDSATNLAKKSCKETNIVLDYWEVINEFIKNSTPNEILLIGGSLYFISAIRSQLLDILDNN